MSDHRIIAIISNALGRTCGRQRPDGLHRLMCCRLAGCRRACTSIRAVVASLRPCDGILPGCGRHRAGRPRPRRMPRVRGCSWLILGGKVFFPPNPPLSLLCSGGKKPGGRRRAPAPSRPLVGGPPFAPSRRPARWRVGMRAHRPRRSASCLGGFRRCPPAGRRPAHPLRCGPVPILGNRPAPLHFFTQFIIAYYNSIATNSGFSRENSGFSGFSACAAMV